MANRIVKEKIKSEQELEPEARTMPDYIVGRRAYARGLDVDSCPHPSGFRRISWMCGWYDVRTKRRLGHIFERRGMQWP